RGECIHPCIQALDWKNAERDAGNQYLLSGFHPMARVNAMDRRLALAELHISAAFLFSQSRASGSLGKERRCKAIYRHHSDTLSKCPPIGLRELTGVSTSSDTALVEVGDDPLGAVRDERIEFRGRVASAGRAPTVGRSTTAAQSRRRCPRGCARSTGSCL